MHTNKLTDAIAADKEIQRNIRKRTSGVTNDMIESCAKRYIRAIKDGRMCCVIHSVSASGMSRVMSFHECDKRNDGKYQYYQFCLLFDVLGYTPAKKHSQAYTIGGCGMDMVFHTNYSIIHKLHALGFLTKKECEELAQKTPTVL